jgi:hypothetical protein
MTKKINIFFAKDQAVSSPNFCRRRIKKGIITGVNIIGKAINTNSGMA